MITRKGKNLYDEFLTTEGRVLNGNPDLVKRVDDDIDLELYIADSGAGKNTWAIAVISVKYENFIYRTKYDGGRVNNDLEIMAEECLANIRVRFDLALWRKWAKEAVEQQPKGIRGFISAILSRVKSERRIL